MIRHRFVATSVTPVALGNPPEFWCVCGMSGTYAAIELHVAQCAAQERALDDTAIVRNAPTDDDFGGGATKAHYLPNAPREPAPFFLLPCRPRGCLAPLNSAGTCTVHNLAGEPERESAPELPPPPPNPARAHSIAESFQDMLRQAFEAGRASNQVGETFETWYQREVLR